MVSVTIDSGWAIGYEAPTAQPGVPTGDQIMNVQVRNMSIPLDFTVKCNKILNDLMEIHAKETAVLDQKLKMAGPTPAVLAQRAALKEKGKRLTMQHLLRACLMAGAPMLDGKPSEIAAKLAEDTVRVGRPSGTRAA